MKISGSFLTMVLIWALGFTHIFGGPYFLFKVIFWIALLPYIVSALLLLFVFFKAKNILKTTYEGQSSVNSLDNNVHETIHVEATIKE
jgi:cytosine/uracil/thiamine/allantoin permease